MEIYSAVMVEPRRHPALRIVLRNFLENLDERWGFIVFHGKENGEWLRNIIEINFKKEKGRIRLIELNIINFTLNEYNSFCISEDYFNNIPTEIFLRFETDTMICPKEKDLIYEFLKYDYVGAPWSVNLIGNSGRGKVGNGGLSLRRKSMMLEVIKKVPFPKYAHEDTYFTIDNKLVKLNMPSYEEAQLFSMETVFSQRCFGIHKPWLYQEDKIEEIESRFPGYKELIRLHL
jgi:hypothetical protein